MCTVCHALRRSWPQWRTSLSPSTPTSLARFQSGSMETFWGMDLESLKLEIRSEFIQSTSTYLITFCFGKLWFICLGLITKLSLCPPSPPIRFNHWFDGMALLHQFKISKGQVTYKSRFLSSDSYQTNKECNRIAVSEFGTLTMPDPCKNFFQRFISRFEMPSEFSWSCVIKLPSTVCKYAEEGYWLSTSLFFS